ncbi:MAG: hypothetical protein ACK4IA_16550 [Paracoccus hibiscisoli]|uniref:hypothetical protein n=1 Tax=Paracoccus hibiscisoli TaxID=2023261 RepID=UPI00391CDC1D
MARKPTAEQIATFQALLEGAEAEVRDAFVAAVYSARARIDLGALIALLEAGDIDGALNMLRMDQGLLWPLEEAVRRSYLAGGSAVDALAPRGTAGAFGFNGRHWRAEAAISRLGADLVVQIEREQVQAIRAVALDGVQTGRGSRPMALDITGRLNRATGRREGGIIGLTGETADTLIRARAILSNPARLREYFVIDRATGKRKPRFALSDARYLSRVAKAAKEGRSLSHAEIDRIMDGHKNRALAYRGKLIGRNEAHTAQAAGRHEAYLQMLDQPDIEAVTVKWIHGFSREPRPDHKRMDGETRPIGQPFIMDDGAAMAYPHDPAGGVRHSASCRCTAFYRAIPRRT